MSMISGSVLGPQNDGPKRKRPWGTVVVIVLMMAVIFGGTYGAVVLLRGGGNSPAPTTSTPTTCVTVTVTPGATLPKPSSVTVNVYNATDRAGLARRTANELKDRGFGIGAVANDPLGKTVKGIAEIRYGVDGLDQARLLRYYVPGATLVKDDRTDATVDLVTGQKFTGIRSQAKVDEALASPAPRPSGNCPTPTRTPSTKPASPSPTPAAS
jgi:hypothetical protein